LRGVCHSQRPGHHESLRRIQAPFEVIHFTESVSKLS
jgi:hypothetical protein